MALVIVGLSVSAGVQAAQPWQEFGQKISAAQQVGALAPDSFGDRLDLYSGAVEFTATDISLPGNSGLPVELARRYLIRDRSNYSNLGGVGNWDFDVPYISGTFAASQGWAVRHHSDPTRFNRCSQPASPATGVARAQPDDIWSGYRLHIPGRGDQELVPLTYMDIGVPNDGQTYRWATQDGARVRCTSSVGVNSPGDYAGEGFIVKDTAGTEYHFTHPTERTTRPLVIDAMNLNVARKEIYLLATKIVDRHQNEVNFSYSGGRLTRILASDGRQVDVQYDGAGRATSASALGGYATSYLYHPNGDLKSVTDAGGATYGYEAVGNLATHYTNDIMIGFSVFADCIEYGYGTGNYKYTVRNPAGATKQYSFELVRHYRDVFAFCMWEIPPYTYVNLQNGGVSNSGGSGTISTAEWNSFIGAIRPHVDAQGYVNRATFEAVWDSTIGSSTPLDPYETQTGPIEDMFVEFPGYQRSSAPKFFDGFTLTRTVETQLGGATRQEDFVYRQPDEFCDTGCAGPTGDHYADRKTVVRSVGSDSETFVFGAKAGVNEGFLLDHQVSAGAQVLSHRRTTYLLPTEQPAVGFRIRFGESLLQQDMSSLRLPPIRETIEQQGTRFASEVAQNCTAGYCFDAFARPTRAIKSSEVLP